MCFVAPAQVIALEPGHAQVMRAGASFPVMLHLLDEPVAVGDWLAVQAGRYAVARLSEAEARELQALYDDIARAPRASGAMP